MKADNIINNKRCMVINRFIRLSDLKLKRFKSNQKYQPDSNLKNTLNNETDVQLVLGVL